MSTHTKTLVAVVGVLLGIVCGEVSMFASEIAVGAGILAVLQMGIYFFGIRSERKRKQTSDTVGITRLFSFPLITILFSVGLLLGIIRVQMVEEKSSYTCETSCSYDAQIISSPEIKNEYQIFKVHPLSVGDEIYDIQIKSTLYPKYEIGETITLSGKVTIPSVIMPHGDTKNKSSGFDYSSYLRTKNVGSEMVYPSIKVVDSEAHTISDYLGRLKENFVDRIDFYVSAPASSLASGMLFGASSMSKELLQTFRTAGLSHIIVLSGFNIVIVITSILFVLAFLPLIVRITLASVSVLIFVVMVGASPSVVRATLMAFIALFAMIVGRAYVAKQALILSLLAIILYEPYALMHDVSLHLSFLATMGLVYMSEPLGFLVTKYCTWLTSSSLRELFITTLAAYFATLPYVMFTFGSVSVYALVANILVVPLVPFAMFISFLVVVSSYILGILSPVLGFVDTVFINSMILIAETIQSFPFSTVTLTISLSSMCLMYIFIFISLKYIFVSYSNETKNTNENGHLTDIISY